MPKESHLELKVGGFVLLALAALTGFIFSVSNVTVFEDGQKLRVVFDFANGLQKSSPVRLAGVEEGLVKDVNLFFDPADSRTKAEVLVRVRKGTRIPADSTFMINQLGLLGEKYVEILPGTDTSSFYKDGDSVVGKSPVVQEQITQKILDISTKIEEGLTSLNSVVDNVKAGRGTVGRFLYDESLYNGLEELTADLKENPWKLLYRPKDKKTK